MVNEKLFIPDKPKSHRQKKVAEEIRAILSMILLRGDFPPAFNKKNDKIIDVPNVITITDVEVAPDFSHAHIFVMPLGGQNQENAVMFLQTIKWFLRKELAKKLTTKVVPDLNFRIDRGFEYVEKIQKILDTQCKTSATTNE